MAFRKLKPVSGIPLRARATASCLGQALTRALLILSIVSAADAGPVLRTASATDLPTDGCGHAIRPINLNAGPRLEFKAQGNTRDFNTLPSLRIATYNMLFWREKLPSDPTKPIADDAWELKKKPHHVAETAATIRHAAPDILITQEVGGLRALDEGLNKRELGDSYRVALIEGNSSRHQHIGILFKKDLPLDIEVQSFRNYHLLSRDLPTLLIRRKGASPRDPPLMLIIGTHFKSQRDEDGDPGSFRIRKAQADLTADIIRSYQSLYGSDLPIILAGDFNNSVHEGPEFQPLWDVGFKDSFDQQPVPIKPEDRVTHTFIPNGSKAQYSQIDAILVSPPLAGAVLQAQAVPYLTQDGNPRALPRNMWERNQDPSDHRMISMELDFKPLRERARKISGPQGSLRRTPPYLREHGPLAMRRTVVTCVTSVL